MNKTPAKQPQDKLSITLKKTRDLTIYPFHQAHPHRFILKGWGIKLRVLGFNPQIKVSN